ncbi:MAG: nuclear transport factor 2 family protein [Steroidobacteraceae bacterium]
MVDSRRREPLRILRSCACPMQRRELSAPSDRIAIKGVLIQTCIAPDLRDWDLYCSAFTADAVIEYPSRFPSCDPRGFAAVVEQLVSTFASTQHYLASCTINVAAAEAESRAYVLAHHSGKPGTSMTYWAGAIYRDRWLRTDDGWRIHRRRGEPLWRQPALTSQSVASLV